jgi:hypothetical protein
MTETNEQPETTTQPPITKPIILQRIDQILAERQPALVEAIRRIRNDEGMRFAGMTKMELDEHFAVDLTGAETGAQLRALIARATMLRREANKHYQSIEIQKGLMESAFDAAKEMINAEIVTSNITGAKGQRVTDGAREVLSNQVYNYQGANGLEETARLSVQITIWRNIVNDLDVTIKTIAGNLMSIANENKAVH